YSARRPPSYSPDFMQHVLKAAAGTAGAEVVAAELFGQLFVAVDNALSPFDRRFRWESPPPFAYRLKSSVRIRSLRSTWSCPPMLVVGSNIEPVPSFAQHCEDSRTY